MQTIEVYREPHRRFAEGDESTGVATAADRELPGGPRARRSDQRDRAWAAPGLRAAHGLHRGPGGSRPGGAAPDRRRPQGLGGRGDRASAPARRHPSSARRWPRPGAWPARLRELVDEGEDPAGIVVLLRAFTHVAALETALTDAGLRPLRCSVAAAFWSQQQIDDLRCPVGVIANPLDDEALFGALAPRPARSCPNALAAAEPPTVEGENGREFFNHICRW